jgi:hypothetical protein
MRAASSPRKHVYTYRLLPLLQNAHGTNTAERCQRLRPEHPARLGCSNCPMTACRRDNRLVKTLIIAALVPEVPVLKDMTASEARAAQPRVAAGAHPRHRGDLVTKKLKDWASQMGQLHVGQQADPTVRLQLEGVELGPSSSRRANRTRPGARQRVLRDLLFEAMGVDQVADWGKDHKQQGLARHRPARAHPLRQRAEDGARRAPVPRRARLALIVDYPFDDPGFGPHDDEQVLEQFRRAARRELDARVAAELLLERR